MSLIVLPTARLYCSCGLRLAPNELAAERMGLPAFAGKTRTCQCGQTVLDETSSISAPAPIEGDAPKPTAPPRPMPSVGEGAAPMLARNPDGRCVCCNQRPASIRLEMRRNLWQEWCVECVEERDSVIAERFSDYLKPGVIP